MIPDVYVGEFRNVYEASKACVTAGQKYYAECVRLISQSRDDYYAAIGIPPGPPVMYGKATDPDDEGAGYGYKNAMRQQERDVFYYHSDHLGSTTYVTDKDGDATQFVSYMPYGEALVDEHDTTCEQPWRFNGKELDAETSLYYYGARYYEPSLALWYGVDAMAGDYPGLGGYVYCAGNPVRLVDVDGRRVKPSNNISLSVIKNTLPEDARQYIRLNGDGFVDVNVMRLYKGDSENFKSLMTLVESDIQIDVTTLTETEYFVGEKLGIEKFSEVEIIEDFADKVFKRCQANTTGECGNLGVTYMPTNSGNGKVDAKNHDSIHININPPVG